MLKKNIILSLSLVSVLGVFSITTANDSVNFKNHTQLNVTRTNRADHFLSRLNTSRIERYLHKNDTTRFNKRNDLQEILKEKRDTRLKNITDRLCDRLFNRVFLDSLCKEPDIAICGDNKINQEKEQCDGEVGINEDQICTNQCLIDNDKQNNTNTSVVINEVLYNPTPETQGNETYEWIELYNNNDDDIDISGWIIGDSNSNDIIPNLTHIKAKGFALITNNEEINTFWIIPETTTLIYLNSSIGGGLNNSGDAIHLKNSTNNTVDSISYGSNTDVFSPSISNVTEGKSISRSLLGFDTNSSTDWIETITPTPGL